MNKRNIFAIILAGCCALVATYALKEESVVKSSELQTKTTNENSEVGEMQPSSDIPSDKELKKKLTPLQYKVTREDGTEPPFRNEYWDNKEAGIYVDIISGKPLFSSLDKFKSGTGWPSFTQPLIKEEIIEHTDHKLWIPRTEVRSKTADAHLGHVFPDGPAPTGLRYCINSAALRFVPVAKLDEAGLGQYKAIFEQAEKK